MILIFWKFNNFGARMSWNYFLLYFKFWFLPKTIVIKNFGPRWKYTLLFKTWLGLEFDSNIWSVDDKWLTVLRSAVVTNISWSAHISDDETQIRVDWLDTTSNWYLPSYQTVTWIIHQFLRNDKMMLWDKIDIEIIGIETRDVSHSSCIKLKFIHCRNDRVK